MVAIVVSMVAMVVVGVLERIVPYRRDWNVNRGDIGTGYLGTDFEYCGCGAYD